MFNWKNPPSTAGLEKARNDALLVLDTMDPIDPEYATTMAHVKTLSDLIANERRELLSPNTVLLAAANIGGIALIVGYEFKNVVTSKALGFVGKLR